MLVSGMVALTAMVGYAFMSGLVQVWCTFLPTTYVAQGKVMFSWVSIILFRGRGWSGHSVQVTLPDGGMGGGGYQVRVILSEGVDSPSGRVPLPSPYLPRLHLVCLGGGEQGMVNPSGLYPSPLPRLGLVQHDKDRRGVLDAVVGTPHNINARSFL